MSSVILDGPGFEASLFPFLKRVRHVCAKDLVPHDEEWLREIVLVAVQLMVNVVVGAVVVEQDVEGVEGEPEAAMVVHALDCRKRKEEDARPGGHPGDEEREGPRRRVEEEALQGVVVEGAVDVGDDEAVVLGVDVLVQHLVHVHVSVHEVLPCVQYKHRDYELQHDHKKRWLWRRPALSVVEDLDKFPG